MGREETRGKGRGGALLLVWVLTAHGQKGVDSVPGILGAKAADFEFTRGRDEVQGRVDVVVSVFLEERLGLGWSWKFGWLVREYVR